MIQYGPTTGQFAAYKEVQTLACDDVLASLQAKHGLGDGEARAMILMVGIKTISFLTREAEKVASTPDTATAIVQACLMGYGWAGIAEFYTLSDGYIATLDTLNNLNVKGDTDLPPTKEKG